MIFDEAFSQEQVTALHAAGPGGDVSQYAWMSNLVAGYHLDEGRGTTTLRFLRLRQRWHAARRDVGFQQGGAENAQPRSRQ